MMLGQGSIARGSRGDAVRVVQQALSDLGFLHGAADGSFGPVSVAALQAFQKSQNLRADGVLGPKTLKALDTALASAPPSSGGSTSGTTPGGTTPAGGDAASIAASDLDTDAQHGKITGAELWAAESKIAGKYGEDAAKQAILGALGQHGKDLAVDAVGWLQGKYGQMDGHIDRFQSILDAHMKGAKLLDLTSTDGKLDDNAEVAVTDASGNVTVQKLDPSLKDRLKIEGSIVDACYAMNDHPHDFAVIKDQTFNKDMWDSVDSNGTFKPKAGVKPSDAVTDIFNNPDKYKFECATGMVIVYYKAMLEMMGPDHFNQVMGNNLKIGPWQYESTLSGALNYTGSGDQDATDARVKNLLPGDYTYFKNWDVSDEAKAGGWQGENVIYLGDGKYFGHPFGVTTGDHIVEYLNQNRKTGGTRTAHLLDLQGRVDNKLAEE
jgi:protein-glutamine gamma-glutamyltransferase